MQFFNWCLNWPAQKVIRLKPKKKIKNNDVSIFFSTDVVFLLNMVIVTCNLYYLGFAWVLEDFRILSFRKFINFVFCENI